MDKRKILFSLLALFFIDGGLHVINWLEIATLPSELLHIIRWVFIVSLGYYAWVSKGLTIYILLCMFLGIEVAEWAPHVAKELKVFSDIFLRLIKTIIAPLLFSTLVVGIAGHSDLKQVGFIAQEVNKLVPEVITGIEGDLEKGEILGITYANLVAVLTKAIQEQQKQIEDLHQKLEAQGKKMDYLITLLDAKK